MEFYVFKFFKTLFKYIFVCEAMVLIFSPILSYLQKKRVFILWAKERERIQQVRHQLCMQLKSGSILDNTYCPLRMPEVRFEHHKVDLPNHKTECHLTYTELLYILKATYKHSTTTTKSLFNKENIFTQLQNSLSLTCKFNTVQQYSLYLVDLRKNRENKIVCFLFYH